LGLSKCRQGNGAIDATIVPEPFNTFGRNKGVGVRFPSDTFYPRQTIAVVLYGPTFMAKRAKSHSASWSPI
jgi:hypothetical protein